MRSTGVYFKENAHKALKDEALQEALALCKTKFQAGRAAAVAALPQFEALRNEAVEIRNHCLENLDFYLELYVKNVEASGGIVHWCKDTEEACNEILKICRARHIKTIAKSKSMLSEEIDLNNFLERYDITPVETDLGEYILQLRKENPSHIIVPAIHLNKSQWQESFRQAHTDLPEDRLLNERRDLMNEARAVLREKFLAADAGLTGANFLVAETGSSVLVTNEGNADLAQTLPKTHIVLASIDKIVPTLEDTLTLLRLLTRSATGQETTGYTCFTTGPKRKTDTEGPEEYHVILLDNGRSSMLGGKYQDMLRCIRCGACLNHCPIYEAIGGHAYGWVYPGPMGAVITPCLIGLQGSADLPSATTACGRCQEVCPVKIPLPSLMRSLREEKHEQKLDSPYVRQGLFLWGFLALHPRLYHFLIPIILKSFYFVRKYLKFIDKLPLLKGWTIGRELPLPENKTFFKAYAKKRQQTVVNRL